ncbi:U2 snRNP SF3b subcomplex component [Komagataella phaffii CBS 7435]|uniref:Splicing factor subunit n=2 Tax=Komagataella phaffii TaxID=460519 RepID=C4QWK3_KOMPG|nr:Hypothetical protein PAS_chr1-1_0256 [Komagataella phaffii GS115]CAH2446333.1 U2 snRNP SF3b subcomplex component [Komagataella phaffii CBS 7435]CAY67626.1 Hypothetical protein PAS_chr1-1_0256 [Komagataella phaffii GS115]CCA36718.1 U2 snRNP SF3b subcomplex component [Komagataella phaffii CBS 7435]
MADKLKEQQVFDQLKSKHLGLGNADTTRKEWLDNIAKDTYATLVQHNPMLEYLSIGLNKPQAITKFEMIEKMAGCRVDEDGIKSKIDRN